MRPGRADADETGKRARRGGSPGSGHYRWPFAAVPQAIIARACGFSVSATFRGCPEPPLTPPAAASPTPISGRSPSSRASRSTTRRSAPAGDSFHRFSAPSRW
ncbi:MAG: hypothetical protein ACK56F_16405, partial [bacterium]